jgi:hypothetical protein
MVTFEKICVHIVTGNNSIISFLGFSEQLKTTRTSFVCYQAVLWHLCWEIAVVSLNAVFGTALLCSRDGLNVVEFMFSIEFIVCLVGFGCYCILTAEGRKPLKISFCSEWFTAACNVVTTVIVGFC